ncbi:hypothetical protein [Desulfovibrio sp. ZJ200]|uniref:hypothetical protein n=1 Tax=Desulfovibrio sp. ZJ200 TaxID=2709792 RepID=UPI0013EE15C7|nr:hypothetical protein [Desulfovibrio sp. ZJ200]
MRGPHTLKLHSPQAGPQERRPAWGRVWPPGDCLSSGSFACRLCHAALFALEHFLFENALLTRKRQPPQRGVHSGENRVFRLNATFDFHKKSKVICSRSGASPDRPHS